MASIDDRPGTLLTFSEAMALLDDIEAADRDIYGPEGLECTPTVSVKRRWI